MNRYQQLKVRGRELVICLPPSYHQSERLYPVAYVQDQGEPFQDSLNYLEHCYASGKLQEVILVGICTKDRNREYTPWPMDALVAGRPAFAGEGRAYVNEVADVIKPWIDSTYRSLSGPEHTAIIGGSFGGLISLFAGYWRPEIFGRIGMLSGSLWYEGVLDYIKEQGALPSGVSLFMSVGRNEGIYKLNAQRSMFPNHLEAYRHWVESGTNEHQLCLIVDPDGTHDPIFMYRKFTDALQWLFTEAAEAAASHALTEPATEPVTEPGAESAAARKLTASGAIAPDGSASWDASVAESGSPRAPAAFSIPGTVTWSLRSELTGRAYRICIAEPMGPPPEGGYPVLYSLDANATFGSLAESIRMQSRTPRGIPPAVVVGIGFDSDSPIASEERFYNYTEYADSRELPARPGGMEWPETGGVAHFLEFIETQLKPRIEEHYPIDRSRQSLFGHSLGGYFALYTLFTRPEAFQRYVAASPSIWWKHHALYTHWENGSARLQEMQPLRELHLYVGREEKPSMVTDARELYACLKPHYHLLKTTYREIEGEGHVSVLPSLFSPLLRIVTAAPETP